MHINIAPFLDRQLGREIQGIPSRALGSLTLRELSAFQTPCNGLYVFSDADNYCRYVGLCSSRSFIGRLSAHADPRLDYNLNNFTKAAVRVPPGMPHEAAVELVLSSKVVLIGAGAELWPSDFNSRLRYGRLGTLEKALQHHMAARFNKVPGNFRPPAREASIRQILGNELLRV